MNANSSGGAFESVVSFSQSAKEPKSFTTRFSYFGAPHDSFTGGSHFGVGFEPRHDGATKIDSSNKVFASFDGFVEISITTRSEAVVEASGGDPLPHPELAVPELSREEFVGSIDMSFLEAIGFSNWCDFSFEGSLELFALSDSEESVNAGLDILHGISLVPVSLDLINKVIDFVFEEVDGMVDKPSSGVIGPSAMIVGISDSITRMSMDLVAGIAKVSVGLIDSITRMPMDLVASISKVSMALIDSITSVPMGVVHGSPSVIGDASSSSMDSPRGFLKAPTNTPGELLEEASLYLSHDLLDLVVVRLELGEELLGFRHVLLSLGHFLISRRLDVLRDPVHFVLDFLVGDGLNFVLIIV